MECVGEQVRVQRAMRCHCEMHLLHRIQFVPGPEWQFILYGNVPASEILSVFFIDHSTTGANGTKWNALEKLESEYFRRSFR